MRRFFLSILFAAVTFALGAGVTSIYYQLWPPFVSLCELARHPEWYDQKVVRVKASASGIFEAVSMSEAGCDADGAGAVVLLDESYKPGPEVESFLVSSKREIRHADILVTGRFDQNATRGCYGPPFGIHATSIELKSPITFEPVRSREE